MSEQNKELDRAVTFIGVCLAGFIAGAVAGMAAVVLISVFT